MATSFQNRVIEILTKKTLRALKQYNVSNLVLGGGVAANQGLRERLKKLCAEENIDLIIPDLKYCTDNAAMIGVAGYYAYKMGHRFNNIIKAKPVDKLC